MFRIKICGVTNVDDALDAAAAGADAIGLNFYRGSKRFIDVPTAESIDVSLPAGVKRIGVFVNAEAGQIAAVAEKVRLSCVQLHGDERPEFLAELPHSLVVIRAFRCGDQGLAPLRSYLADCRALGRMPDAILVDADAGKQFGGTGRPAEWKRIALERELIAETPLILGGGLTPTNVADAIASVRPDGVDVASGVEREPGRKDAALVRQFVAAARGAFARL